MGLHLPEPCSEPSQCWAHGLTRVHHWRSASRPWAWHQCPEPRCRRRGLWGATGVLGLEKQRRMWPEPLLADQQQTRCTCLSRVGCTWAGLGRCSGEEGVRVGLAGTG